MLRKIWDWMLGDVTIPNHIASKPAPEIKNRLVVRTTRQGRVKEKTVPYSAETDMLLKIKFLVAAALSDQKELQVSITAPGVCVTIDKKETIG